MKIDNRVWGIMIAKFVQQDYMQNLVSTDKNTGKTKDLTKEDAYEAVISLLEKGYLRIYSLGGGKSTILPKGYDWEDITDTVYLPILKGKYKEMAKLLSTIKGE